MGGWIMAAQHGTAGAVHVYRGEDGRPERVTLANETDRAANHEAIDTGIRKVGWRLIGTRGVIDMWCIEIGEHGEPVWLVRASDVEAQSA